MFIQVVQLPSISCNNMLLVTHSSVSYVITVSGFVTIVINIILSYPTLSMLSFESVTELNTMGWYPLANLNNFPVNRL
jgi:hypothetical protein